MSIERCYYVYIMTNQRHTTLYIGITNNLSRRPWEHKEKTNHKSFTSRYNICELVYYEIFRDVIAAIAREKQIKAGSRQKKIDLINSANPEWNDLYESF